MLWQFRKFLHCSVLVGFAWLPALAQRPVIKPNGIVNAASLAIDEERGMALVPGGISTIFGSNLAAATAMAPGYPLPTNLAGTTVTVGGMRAPLFYVSETQINFQAPYVDIHAPPPPVVQVTTAAGPSDPVEAAYVNTVGIFTQDGSGCGPGAILNVKADGTVSLNTRSNSVSPGDYLAIYATGLGRPFFPPMPGVAAGSSPLPIFLLGGALFFQVTGFQSIPGLISPSRPYLAPGFAGLIQVDGQITDEAPEGCNVPLRLSSDVRLSQPVTVSIRKGGGPCQDPPSATHAALKLTRTVVTGPEPGGIGTSESFEATLVSAPENLLRGRPLPVVIPDSVGTIGFFTVSRGPNCPGSGGQRLDAGSLTILGGGSPVTVRPSPASGELIYSATLPEGTIRPGAVRVEAAGGTDLEPFVATYSWPTPITVTTPLPPGTVIPRDRPFTLTWSGGSADLYVRVRIVVPSLPFDRFAEAGVPGNQGSATVRFDQPPTAFPRNSPPRVVVLVTPVMADTFSAPGLTRPGTKNWTYEYHFTGLEWSPPR